MCFRFSLLGRSTLSGLGKAVLISPLRLFRTWRLLSQLEVGAVNFHYASLDALGIAILKSLRLFSGRLLLSFHGTDVPREMPRLTRELWRFVLRYTDGVTACSSSLGETVSAALQIPISRVTVVANGVDKELFSPKMRMITPPSNFPRRFLVSIGSFIPRKGHRLLLEAFSRVANEHPDLHLVIVGSEGPEREALGADAARWGLAARLHCFVDKTPTEVAWFLSNATACVQPSEAEPFGIAVIEAGACGTPVIATSVGGHSELLVNNETGLLFAPRDIKGCEAQLRLLLDNPERTCTMADSFRTEVLSRYAWSICAEAYLRLSVPPH